MTHIAAWLFFALSLLAAFVTLHMTVRSHWYEILAALRGELGATGPVRRAKPAAVPSVRPRRAAA